MAHAAPQFPCLRQPAPRVIGSHRLEPSGQFAAGELRVMLHQALLLDAQYATPAAGLLGRATVLRPGLSLGAQPPPPAATPIVVVVVVVVA